MKYCINCGAKIPKDAIFCPACGHKQTYSSEPNNSDVNIVHNIHNDQSTSHIAKPKKSKSTAWLLWLFLGWTGAHRFYLHTKEAYLTPILYGIIFLYMIIFNHVIKFVSLSPNSGVFISNCKSVFYIGIVLYLIWWIIDAFHINQWLQFNNTKKNRIKKYHPIQNYRVLTLAFYIFIIFVFAFDNHMLIYWSFIY